MKYKLYLFCILFFFGSTILFSQENSIHQFTVNDIYGESYSLEQLKGKKVLVVNTASQCGLTPQYEVLEKVYQENKEKGFTIIGFPANNFGEQEPGSNQEIVSFCNKNYGVSFQMMSKISVKGEDQHPLYKWLTNKELNKVKDAPVVWNFQKFLIDEDGYFVDVLGPKESPDNEVILNWINDKN